MQNAASGWPDVGPENAWEDHRDPGFTLMAILAPGIDYLIERFSACPWPATSGDVVLADSRTRRVTRPLYTPEERVRRDQTPWTLVQGVLAPIQFLVFLISLGLVLNYLATGRFYEAATASVVLKTGMLYTIMITGAIWEKKVFGRYLFAESFFWEDLFSMLVIALHTAYLVALIEGWGAVQDRMILALAAYASYSINATQFLLKLRKARLEAPGIVHGSASGAIAK
jgi:3-vinyl bacteriochlorophyllide hydratase